jgi:hypothetical protein
LPLGKLALATRAVSSGISHTLRGGNMAHLLIPELTLDKGCLFCHLFDPFANRQAATAQILTITLGNSIMHVSM